MKTTDKINRINKAVNKILDAQLILAEIQSQCCGESEIEFWADRVEDCMYLARQIEEKNKNGCQEESDAERELKLCPFCGTLPYYHEAADEYENNIVVCPKCNCTKWSAEEWNIRVNKFMEAVKLLEDENE